MNAGITREEAFKLLIQYNKESFHIRHALTLEKCMGYFAEVLGFGSDGGFWSTCGLLHDIDFERWPDEHCKAAPGLLADAGCTEELIHSVCSHAYGIMTDIAPVHEMEKVLFAIDELTGLIGAAALMRPSKSCRDMEISSLKKKFKDKKFAAGCSRDIISQGAQMLGWELNELLEKTLDAMKASEDAIENLMSEAGI